MSLVTAAILGYGDISPTSGWLRLMGLAQAMMLPRALDHFAEALQTRFIDAGPDATTREVLEAYAADHRRTGAARL